MILRGRTQQADFLLRTALTTPPSFRTERADFFFRIRSCECFGLRRETSAPSRAFCGMKSLFSSPHTDTLVIRVCASRMILRDRPQHADFSSPPAPHTVISNEAGRLFSSAFAPANASARAERNLSSLFFRAQCVRARSANSREKKASKSFAIATGNAELLCW